MTVLTTNEQNSLNSAESYMENLTPPNNKQNFSQIVHRNDKKTMNINKHHKSPPMNTKDLPMVTGSNRRKSARIHAAGSGSELKAPPKLSRTPKSNAFLTSTSVKQKQIHSPTKSSVKKTKQKRSDATPMDEDTPNAWKTMMSKSAKVAGYVAKQLLHGNDSDEVWSSAEDTSGDEVEFVKKTRLFVKTTDSSGDIDDDSVQILGVKNPDKTNYYANLIASMAGYSTDEDEVEEDDDDGSTKMSNCKDALLNFKSKNNNDPDDVFASNDDDEDSSSSSSSSFPSSSDSDTMSDAPPVATKTNRKRTKIIKTASDTRLEGRKEPTRKPQ
jgi:hypothetical protein